MEKQFLQYVKQHKLWRPGDTWLLAISGGSDSMVLCHVAQKCKIPVMLAHVNFQLRGFDSDEDERFVMEYAKAHRLICHSIHFDTREYAALHHLSIESAARDLRYHWFETVRFQNKLSFTATAHHLDDQVETLFMNLLKGTGIAGLRSIMPKKNSIIRPLLFATHAEILNYAKKHRLSWREDASNKDEHFTRNKIRARLIPLLKELNPNLHAAMGSNFSIFNDLDKIYSEQVHSWQKKYVEHRRNADYILLRKLAPLKYKRSVLFELLRPFGFSSGRIDEILQWMKKLGQGKQWLSQTHRLLSTPRFLILTELAPEKASIIQIEEARGTVACDTCKLKLSTHTKSSYKISRLPEVANLDLQKLSFPMIVRPWEAGDYFYPFGLGKKSNPAKKARKKISDYLNDLKLDPLEKENISVLCCGEKIVWVVGYRIDTRFAIEPSSTEVCKIKLMQGKPKSI